MQAELDANGWLRLLSVDGRDIALTGPARSNLIADELRGYSLSMREQWVWQGMNTELFRLSAHP